MDFPLVIELKVAWLFNTFLNMSLKQDMENAGWVFNELYCYKMFGEYEIDIEFCIGDFCVGIYKDQELVEPKLREPDFIQALLSAGNLQCIYEQTTGNI